jgi:dTDP-4-dehydrorhamnose reductase
LLNKKNEIQVVHDQIGSPTYTPDLVDAVLSILKKVFSVGFEQKDYGVFNFSNEGVLSWYDFAVEIIKYADINCRVIPVPSIHFPRPAPRPSYSVFDLTKIRKIFGIVPVNWMKSLHHCLDS